jgi:hypothetical protein
MRFSALVAYQVGGTDSTGASFDVSQFQHRISVGLRAALAPPRSATVTAAPVKAVAPPAMGRIRGVVRAASPGDRPSGSSTASESGGRGAAGAPLAGIAVEIPGRSPALTSSEGAFVLDNVPPGLVKLRIGGKGWVTTEEVVSVPGEGEVMVELALRAVEAPLRAGVVGLVRTENGTPVAAVVRVVELGITTRADAGGSFRLEIPAGRYTLTIEASGFVAQRKTIQVGAGERNIYNVDLQVAP